MKVFFVAMVGLCGAAGVAQANGASTTGARFAHSVQGQSSISRPNFALLAGTIDEGFDDITTLPGADWLQINHSSSPGANSWFQGVSTILPAFDGAATAYIGAN